MDEKSLNEIDAKEFMPQIAISQLSYNQIDIDDLLTEGKFDEKKINDYIEKREKSEDKDLKTKGEIERKLFDKGAFAIIEGYTFIAQESSGTGFGAIAVQAPDGEVIIGYRGTDFPDGAELLELMKEYTQLGVSDRQIEIGGKVGDAIADAQIIIGQQEIKQQNEAIAFAKEISMQTGVNPKEITVVGHSLGGGLAQSVAIHYDAKAYTFNGVGTVQNMTDVIEKNGKSIEDYDITHLVNNRDIVAQAGEKAGKIITVVGSKMQEGVYGIEMTKEEYEIMKITMPEAISTLKKMKWDENKKKYTLQAEVGLDFETHSLYDLIGDNNKIIVDETNRSYISQFKDISNTYVQICKFGEQYAQFGGWEKFKSGFEGLDKIVNMPQDIHQFNMKAQVTIVGLTAMVPSAIMAFVGSDKEKGMLEAMKVELLEIRLDTERIKNIRTTLSRREKIKKTTGFTLSDSSVTVSDFVDEELNIEISLREVRSLKTRLGKMGEKLVGSYVKELNKCTSPHSNLRRVYKDYPSVTSACDLAEREIDRVSEKLKDIGKEVIEKSEAIEKALKQYYEEEMECLKILQSVR